MQGLPKQLYELLEAIHQQNDDAFLQLEHLVPQLVARDLLTAQLHSDCFCGSCWAVLQITPLGLIARTLYQSCADYRQP
jgi:hypothetical protein